MSNNCCSFTQPANAFFAFFEASEFCWCSLAVVDEAIDAHDSNNMNLKNCTERPQQEFDTDDRYLPKITWLSYEKQHQKTCNDVPKHEITFLNALPTSFNTVAS